MASIQITVEFVASDSGHRSDKVIGLCGQHSKILRLFITFQFLFFLNFMIIYSPVRSPYLVDFLFLVK